MKFTRYTGERIDPWSRKIELPEATIYRMDDLMAEAKIKSRQTFFCALSGQTASKAFQARARKLLDALGGRLPEYPPEKQIRYSGDWNELGDLWYFQSRVIHAHSFSQAVGFAVDLTLNASDLPEVIVTGPPRRTKEAHHDE